MTITLHHVADVENRATVDNGWLACDRCRAVLYRKRLERRAMVCYQCGNHFRLTAPARLDRLLDPGSQRHVRSQPTTPDPLGFTDLIPYPDRLARARSATGLEDAVSVARGAIRGFPVVVAAMDFRFLGGSLGCAAGEAVATAAETALADRLPLLLITASGGARMQEGVLSLMQMVKTSNAMAALDGAGLLTVTLVTDPTFGGVAASFATQSDVILAEPGARMGFAGPRVIEQTIAQRLPDGFQSAEFLLEHGLVDDVRARFELPAALSSLFTATRPADARQGRARHDPVVRDPTRLERRRVDHVVELARHPARPTLLDHAASWCDDFLQLHGDREGSDCRALIGGLAHVDGTSFMLIGHQKGHTTDERARHDFGMPSPGGYRKAVRLMRLAAKLGIPVVTLIDTPGAHPGLEAERGGQANAIAECLRTMGSLPVPVVSVITGEGGSGGALALAVADRVLQCEYATYSVISPEGCAAILWRSPAAAATAAGALRLDAGSLLELGVIDGVVPEPAGGAARDPAGAGMLIRDAIVCALAELRGHGGRELIAARRSRFRRFGRLEAMNGTDLASST